jgi:hypothetical protein
VRLKPHFSNTRHRGDGVLGDARLQRALVDLPQELVAPAPPDGWTP